MSEVTFEDILYHLANNPDPAVRTEATELLARYVKELTDEEYERAHKALNQALADPAASVVMGAMQALSRYNRKAREQARQAKESGDTSAAIAIPLCKVCNKPEAIADGKICPHDNCPYR